MHQMRWWQGVSLQRRRRLFGLLITVSFSKLSLWWAKYKVMQIQTRSHSPLNLDYKTVREVKCYLTNDYCIKTYLTHIYYSTIRAKERTACWWWMKARRSGVKPTVYLSKFREGETLMTVEALIVLALTGANRRHPLKGQFTSKSQVHLFPVMYSAIYKSRLSAWAAECSRYLL